MKRWRIGFVVPRYGENVLGGAETLARCLAEQAVAVDLAEVEVLTTCAINHYNWKNELPAGETMVNQVPVRRFPIDVKYRDLARYDTLNFSLLQGQTISPEEQYEWVHHSAHSPELYAYLEAKGSTFDVLFFVPYLFGTTFYGSAIHPERSVLWPCLHNEIYAYLEPARGMYLDCLGVMFNTYPEMRLATRLYGQHSGAQVVGFGFSPLQSDGERFRKNRRLRDPFILYSGRIEGAKNVPLLCQYFLEYKQKRKGDLKLVLMGTGPEAIPADSNIINLGFRQGQEKLDVHAAAMVLCQPSINESFSIVMMESWLCGVPVLVHADCEVTRYNVTQSNGGLYFREYEEFEEALDLLLTKEAVRQRMGKNGNEYVLSQYSWEAVLERFAQALTKWSALKRE